MVWFSMNDINNLNFAQSLHQDHNKADYIDYVTKVNAVNNLIKSTDFDSVDDRAKFQMHIINMMTNDKSLDIEDTVSVVIALSSHISFLMNMLDDDDREMYFTMYQEDFLNRLVEDE